MHNIRLYVFIIVFTMLIAGCNRSHRITVKDANIIATNHLHEYCHQDHVDIRQLSAKGILGPKSLYGVEWWVFQYKYKNRDNAKILISVSEYGASDIIAIGPGIPRNYKLKNAAP